MIDVDAVTAIDFHTHADVSRSGADGLTPVLRSAAATYFGEAELPTAEDVAAYYRLLSAAGSRLGDRLASERAPRGATDMRGSQAMGPERGSR